MMEIRRHCWNKSHVYELPAIAWKRALDELRAVAYGPKGGRSANSESLYSAIAKIADNVRTFELHPAFTPFKGVVGADTTVAPGFLTPDGQRSPYPPGKFGLLCPHHISRMGTTLTTWSWGDWCLSDEPCHREGFHLRFVVGE